MNNMNNKLAVFKETLANFLGVEVDDISNEDSLSEDLHMQASDLSDFLGKLEALDFDVTKTDLTKIETVEDLMESLEIEENT